MAGIAIVIGVLSAFIFSTRIRSTPGFFITAAVLPLVVSLAICLIGAFLQGATSITARLVTIAIALGLIRFRSAQGKAEELLVLLSSVVIGLILGLGFLLLGAIFGAGIPLVFLLVSFLPFFKHKRFAREKLLKVTIPESLEYSDIFEATFSHYLREVELVEVKTTGMGSMFRLSYRIVMKNAKEEKELIDELRVKNGNLEISIVPYTEPLGKL